MSDSDPISKLETTLETLHNLTARMKGSSGIHQIDIDLLQQKTRELYEQIILLESVPMIKSAEQEPLTSQPQPENIPSEEKIIEEEEIELEEAKKEETEPEPEIEPEPESIREEVYEDVVIETVKDEPASVEREIPEPRSTMDLFSETEDDSLGAVLEHQSQPNVGEKLEHSPVGDLREAIGINDKFQFVNELFNGDLEQYNHVLDELNNFSSLQGALTYLSELSVQYDFKKSGMAFQRLQALLRKKYA